MSTTTTDVLIVGAGPAGLALACALETYGLRATLVERRADIANTSRAAVIHARTLEVLERVGATSALLAAGIKVPVFHVRDRDRSLLEVQFQSLETRYPFTLMCPQDVTERVLRDCLSALGGSIKQPKEVASIVPTSAGVHVTLNSPGGREEIVASWVVGCDGAHSLVRTQAGIPFDGRSYDETFVLADVRLDWPLPRDEVDLFLSPAGLMVVAPLPNDRFRIVATTDAAPDEPDGPFVQSILDQRGPTRSRARIVDVIWTSRFHLAHRVTSAPLSGRILLCGDAAHVHSPAGGQGMNTGIQDAIALAEPLSRAIRTEDETGLAAWSDRRHEIAKQVVAMTDRMTRAATARSFPARVTRNALLLLAGNLPGVTKAFARRLAELDY